MNDNTTPHLSKEYDLNVGSVIPFYKTIHEEIIKLVQSLERAPEQWLDTGCGTGSFVKMALHSFERTHFYLSDPSSSMLEQAREKLKEPGDTRIVFLDPVATGGLPERLSGTFDVVTAIQSHHYLSKTDRARATRRCFELLRPGGMFLTFENIRPMTEAGLQIARNYWRQFQLAHGNDLPRVEKQLARFDREYFPITVEEHISLLQSTGFRAVELFWFSYMQSGFFSIK